jgi:hypothetical protein
MNLLKPFKIYLETTIFNFKFAEDSPDKKADTMNLLALKLPRVSGLLGIL